MVDRSPARRAPWSPDEEWADIPGYEGTYWISSHGQLLARGRPGTFTHTAPLKHVPAAKGGYATARLCLPGHGKTFYIHHLVAEAFIGARPHKTMICHGDNNPMNPHVENLRYDTPSANARDMVIAGRSQQSIKTHCPAGHEYNKQNTLYREIGDRICRLCVNQRNADPTVIRRKGSNPGYARWTDQEDALFGLNDDASIVTQTGRSLRAVRRRRVVLLVRRRRAG